MKHRTFFETTRCPHCGQTLDGHMAMGADARPEPGDVSICAFCAGVSEHGPDLQLVVPPADRLAAIFAHPDVIRVQRAIQKRRPVQPGSARSEGPDR